jgi:DNA-binding transcriptional regulator YiaG
MKELIDQYTRVVEWSDEDQCFVGRCPELFLGGCHGADAEAVDGRLRAIIADVLRDYRQERQSPPPPARRAARLNTALEARRRTGLNQCGFARALGVATATVRNWEQGRIRPKGTAATLLRLIERRPELLREIAQPRGNRA